uniref:Uncharacterized protein n=1 Tax=Anguilla anguilla TaxID=7936 RepID=A0A0E9XNK1_ANGAN
MNLVHHSVPTRH